MTQAKGIRLNTDTGFLKLIAITAMLIDHVGSVFFPDYRVLRYIGRLAFPLFAYCIAVGAVYTRSMPKYAARLLLMAVVSQPLYSLALRHTTPAMNAIDFTAQPVVAAIQWYVYSLKYSNILFALLLGLLVIYSIQEKKYIFTGLMVILVHHWNPYMSTSYGFRGVALMVMFYAFLDRPLTSLFWVGLFMAWWGSSYTLPLDGQQFSFRISMQFYALLALPLIYVPMNTRLRVNKWVFYLFYPLHLLGIYLIDAMF